MEERDEQLETSIDASQNLAEKLRTRIPFPTFAESFLGKDILNEFYKIMENPEVIECDMLDSDESLNKKELLEYVTLLPIYHETRTRIKELAQKIIDKLKDNIKYNLSKSLDRKGNLTKKPAIIDFMNTPSTIFDSQKIQNAGYRNGRIEELVLTVSQLIFYEIITALSIYEKDKILTLAHLIRECCNQYSEKTGYEFPGILGFEIANKINSIIKNNRIPLEGMFPDKKIGQTELEEDTELNFLEVRNLSEFRKIKKYAKDFGKIKIEIFGDEYQVWEEYKPIYICVIRIILGNLSSQTMPVEKKNPAQHNRTELYHPESNNSFDLYLDRATGDLYPAASTIPISKILKKDEYVKFKYAITKFILEYLQGKEEDIPQLLTKIYEKESAEQASEQEVDRLAKIETEKIKAELKKQYAYKKDPQQEEDIQEKEQEQTEASEKTPSSVYKRFINGKRLKRALEILLGPSTGQTGSHIKFRSKKDGNNYPIAIHPGTDVGVGLLTKCLKNFGITPEELEEIW